MPKEAIILTHMFVRYLTDFGNVIRYLESDGYKVIIYASPPKLTREFSTDSPNMFGDYQKMLPSTVEVKRLPYCRGKIALWDVFRMMALGFRLAYKHPDALFFLWSIFPIAFCGLPLRIFNRKCLFLVTGLGPILGSKGRRFLLSRTVTLAVYSYLMSGRSSRCLNHNSEDKCFLVKKLHAAPEKFFVTPGCGVDPKVFPFFEKRASNPFPIAVVPARLIHDKGFPEAIEASRILRDRGIAHEMWFTGALEPYPWISITQEEIDLAVRENPCVKFIGYQANLVQILEKVDIVCLPTRYPEGTPTALIEAAATGRVAVTCDTVGAREIVLNEQTGLVVPQKNPLALADALQRVMADPNLYERLRRKAHEHFLQNYTKDIVLKATLAAVESMQIAFKHEMTAPDIRTIEPGARE